MFLQIVLFYVIFRVMNDMTLMNMVSHSGRLKLQ